MLPFVGDNLPYISTDSYIHVSGRYACDSIILGWRYLPATASAERGNKHELVGDIRQT